MDRMANQGRAGDANCLVDGCGAPFWGRPPRGGFQSPGAVGRSSRGRRASALERGDLVRGRGGGGRAGVPRVIYFPPTHCVTLKTGDYPVTSLPSYCVILKTRAHPVKNLWLIAVRLNTGLAASKARKIGAITLTQLVSFRARRFCPFAQDAQKVTRNGGLICAAPARARGGAARRACVITMYPGAMTANGADSAYPGPAKRAGATGPPGGKNFGPESGGRKSRTRRFGLRAKPGERKLHPTQHNKREER
jgi:hypothetical protein